MSDLNTLLSTEIPEGLQSLADSHVNLERVAEYCESNYFQVDNKREALDETKRYTTQSLASVAYQVNTLAYHFLQLLDLQTVQLDEMAAQASHIAQSISIHKEKVARREIGVLTSAKTPSRQYKILAPATPEKPVKYVRKPIDYSVLDELGCGASRSRQIAARSSLKNSVLMQNMVTLPPSSKPPTPPMGNKMGTLRSNTAIYRTPAAAAVVPPQVPTHYAPNYPLGTQRRTSQSSINSNNSGSISVSMGSGSGSIAMSTGSGYGTNGNATGMNTMNRNTINSMKMSLQQAQGEQYTTLPLQMNPQHQVTQNQIPLSGTGIPFRQRDIQPMSQQQMIYADNKALGIPNAPASPPLPPPPDMSMSVEVENPMIPKVYLEKVIAVYDYTQEREDELSFQENSLIYVLKKNDDGWYEGVLNGKTGLFPGNYVEPCI